VSVVTGREIIVRFAEFELDLRSGELRTNGTSVRLQPQPARILSLLVRRRGETVTRTEIIEEVWGSETFVDYDQGLNFAIRQIRSALGDDAEHPAYVETVPKRGYRFVSPVEGPADISVPIPENPPGMFPGWRGRTFKAAGAILLAALVLLTIPKSRRWLMGRMNKQPVQSLAVLPFENLSGDSSKDYFADGFTDELITDLAEQTKIRVVSRSSVMRYKGSRKPLPEMARELGVDAIVEGSVTISDQQVRITAQLIEAASDRHLWAHSYERDRKDLFPIQSEVASTIAGLIRANTETHDAHGASSSPRFTPETYELYLVCRSLGQQTSEENQNLAIKCYEHVLTLDPNSASAYAGIAHANSALGLEHVPRARAAALKAVELDPSLAETHDALACVKTDYDKDFTGAEGEFKKALALNPSYARAHLDYAPVLLATRRPSDAITEVRTARELDPFSAGHATFSGMILFMAGQYDKAIEEERAALELDPQREHPHYWTGYAYEQQKLYDKAIAEYEKVLPNDDHGVFLAALGRSLSLAGDSKKAEEMRRRLERLSGDNFAWPYDAALLYAVLGNKDRAFDWLEKDLKQHDGWLLLLNVDPRLSPLRSDPRFRSLVRRAGLPAASPN
jgi:TolB-like protein/DNA-binding winged helix-turn-helix (wHTH) protein/Flp pilus assembly protein TadD